MDDLPQRAAEIFLNALCRDGYTARLCGSATIRVEPKSRQTLEELKHDLRVPIDRAKSDRALESQDIHKVMECISEIEHGQALAVMFRVFRKEQLQDLRRQEREKKFPD